MKIGFLTACFGNKKKLEELVSWASQEGFETMELRVKDFALEDLTEKKAEEIKNLFKKNNIIISSLAAYDNNLHPNPEVRKQINQFVKKTIDAAKLLQTPLVGTFIGRNPSKTIKENLEEFKTVFSELLEYAEKNNIKLMLENCPMIGWQFEGLIGQLAYSPEMWQKIFDTFPSDSFGLNFDPSHLIWQGIDYIQAVKEFKSKIFHTHAKDTEILHRNLAIVGIYGHCWRYRMPGLGDIDWKKYISTLQEIGYDGVLSIEHEDPVWHGSEEKIKRGLIFGLKYLKQFIV